MALQNKNANENANENENENENEKIKISIKKYVTPYISNKRYTIITSRLEELLGSMTKELGVPCDPYLNDILQIICDETNYDPNVKQYNEQKAESIRRYQKKKAEIKKLKKLQITN